MTKGRTGIFHVLMLFEYRVCHNKAGPWETFLNKLCSSTCKILLKILRLIWQEFFHKKFHNGKCFTLTFDQDIMNEVISRVHVTGDRNICLFVHVHEQSSFAWNMQSTQKFIIWSNSEIMVSVDLETFELIDFHGIPCNNNDDYNLQYCLDNYVYEVIFCSLYIRLLYSLTILFFIPSTKILQENLRMFDCVAPFGIHFDNLCKNKSTALKASETIDSILSNHSALNLSECLLPCKFMNVGFDKSVDVKPHLNEEAALILHFPKVIKSTRSYYSYQGLELIAEFGGYVGLFLGISVCQLSDLFTKIIIIAQRK